MFLAEIAPAFDEPGFRLAVFTGPRTPSEAGLKKVTVRSILIKGVPKFQVNSYDEHKGITKNLDGVELQGFLSSLASMAFKYAQIETSTFVDNLIFSKKGKVHRVRTHQASLRSNEHDRRKALPLSGEGSKTFLRAIGITNSDGTLKSDKARKYRQINEFVRLVTEPDGLSLVNRTPMEVVDFGCGNAYLTFALHHYLNDIVDRPARLLGVDSRQAPLCKHTDVVHELGIQGLSFLRSSIQEADLSVADMVVALHACDTATDEAIFQGIRLGSKIIVVVPCCHQNLQKQLVRNDKVKAMKGVRHFGILQERLGDVLTDTYRGLILESLGYRCDIVQFVSTEDSAKNLMIRAILSPAAGEGTPEGGTPRLLSDKLAAYQALKEFWGVTPYLETLLADASLWCTG